MKTFFRNISLRTKLALLYSALLIASVVMVGYFSYWDIWQILIQNKASQLRALAKPVIENWLIDQNIHPSDSLGISPEKARRLAIDLTSRNAVALVLNRNGQVLANGRRLPEEPVAPAVDKQWVYKALSGMNEITYLTHVKGKRILVALIPLRLKPGKPPVLGVVQINSPLSDVRQILFRHGSRLLMAVALVLILGIWFGFWLIGINLKDLQKLAAACQQIAKGDFSQRASVTQRKDEIGKLAGSFNIMVDKIEKLFNAQKRFVAGAAHELLTPLTGLRGSLEVLLRGAQDDPKAVNRLSKGMYQQVQHLIRLCEQLLGLSRLENALNVNKKPVVLEAFVDAFEQKIQDLFPGHRVAVQKGPYVLLRADPDLLEQICFNLISNAIRYASAQESIRLGWRLVPDFVEIWVKDRGPGMDAETLAHVFEPFYRGKTHEPTPEKGAGLGLTLTRAMVEAHGGSIRIESSPGKGTTVFFTLPL